MTIDLDALFAKEAFRSIDPERMALFRQFAQSIDGKSTPEVVTLFMQFNQAISKKKPISPQERAAITTAIVESLPDKDRGKFQSMLRLLKV